jgi:hypothetical protein
MFHMGNARKKGDRRAAPRCLTMRPLAPFSSRVRFDDVTARRCVVPGSDRDPYWAFQYVRACMPARAPDMSPGLFS